MKQKLVDANELLTGIENNFELIRVDGTMYVPCIDYADEICCSPEVEAIPVEWLEWYRDHRINRYGKLFEEFDTMLEEWRYKNEQRQDS